LRTDCDATARHLTLKVLLCRNMSTKDVLVEGNVTWINPYKGGARPPPEIEAEGRRTKPCASAILHVRRAGDASSPFDLDSPPIAELRTDDVGNFSLSLSPGKYDIFRAAKFGKPTWYDQDQTAGGSRRLIPGGCMDAAENALWRRSPDCSLVVPDPADCAPNGAEAVASAPATMTGVMLHWVNGMERGLPLPC